MPSHLLKSAPEEKTPPVKLLPPNTIEVNVHGVVETLNVFEALEVISAEESQEVSETVTPGSQDALSAPDKPLEAVAVPKRGKGRKTERGQKHGSKSLFKSQKHKKGQKAKFSAPAETRLKLPEANVKILEDYFLKEAPLRPNGAFIRYMERPSEELAEEVEYDLDEEDCEWLKLFNNEKRLTKNLQPVPPDVMELFMDRLEKECYFQMQSNGLDSVQLIDDDAVCCVCMDGECQNSNAILFCDMCNLAIHQECFGVPYIPEGQWWCRRCLLSPSRAVECILCPNKGGAFKETVDGRWAHVVCAIWIPEVCFANTVFLEPIDCIENIPSARWKLTCFICKQKNKGACIQCYKTNCYIAFHVTCAQQAGLCMRIETNRTSSNNLTVKKTAYCENHAPADFIKERNGASFREKLAHTRRILAEKRSVLPPVSIPVIPEERVSIISAVVPAYARKSEFVDRIMGYWKLKRMSRNGVPLLRRLQAASLPPPGSIGAIKPMNVKQMEETKQSHAYFVRLRQDLERARLLCELIRKREKLKRERIYAGCRELDMRIQPMNYFLNSIVDDLIAKDVQKIFTQPVDIEQVPDYSTVVTNPMDLSTIQKKIFEFEYDSVDEMFADFQLMVNNCLLYNAKDTVFYRAGIKMQEIGGIVFRAARRNLEKIGFDKIAGTLLKNAPQQPEEATDEDLSRQIEQVLENKERHALPYDKHLRVLEEALDSSLSLSHPVSKKKKYLRIRTEIGRLKKRKRLVEKRIADETDDLEESDNEDEEASVTSSEAPSSIRNRLRSLDDHRQIERRLSRTDAVDLDLTNENTNQELSLRDNSYFRGPTASGGPSPPRPGRGRPRKISRLVRGRGSAGGHVPAASSSRGVSLRDRGPRTVPRGTGRTRGGKSRRIMSVRRSPRSASLKQAPVEKEVEQAPASRQGSPNRSSPVAQNRARQTRERTPKIVSSSLPLINNVANVIARAAKLQSPKSIETAAKSIICERVQLEKANKKCAEAKKLKKKCGDKQKRNNPGAIKLFYENSFKGASQPLRQTSPAKPISENHVVEDAIRHVAKSGKIPSATSPMKKSYGRPRKLLASPRYVFNEKEQRSIPLPLPADGQHPTFDTLTSRVMPVTNGLEKGDPVSTAVGILSSKLAAQGVNMSKRKLRGTSSTPNNNNNALSSSAQSHLKKSDSFLVYRSGGNPEMHSSEAESGKDDDDEGEEEEEEDEEDDDDDDDDDEEEDEEVPQEPGKPVEVENEQGAESDESSEPEAAESGTSDSDSSSTGSSTSSSSLSSDSSTSSKASSSSSITTPKHFRPKSKKTHRSYKHSSTFQTAVAAGLPGAQGRIVRQQTCPSVNNNNNNNVTVANKEADRDSSPNGSAAGS